MQIPVRPMQTPTERLNKLRRLYHEYQTKLAWHKEVASKAAYAKDDMERAHQAFLSCQSDLVGDLFNGCFGEEWLLDVGPYDVS